MQQITRSIYLVDAGEVVTVTIKATKVINSAFLVIDGGIPPVVKPDPLTYQFKVTVGPGNTHHGMVQCHFANATPSDAKFEVFVSGDKGGGVFTGSDILKTDFSWRRSIEFRR